VIQRIAATVIATLILWFAWWFFGVLMALWLNSISHILGAVAAAIWWLGIVAIPVLVWFRFRHVR
jgi:hypothetical protein